MFASMLTQKSTMPPPPDETWISKLERGRVKFATKFPDEYAWFEYQARVKYMPETWLLRPFDNLPESAQLVILDEVRDTVASYMRWTP